jgi:two-component sensor histidine kinase
MVRLMAKEASGDAQYVLRDVAQRIFTLGRVYDHLDKSGLARLDLAAYLDQVCRQAITAFAHPRLDITTRITPCIVGSDLALTLGLIANELVTNAIKHGYDAQQGLVISVQFETGGGRAVLTVRDNGPGLRPNALSQSTGLTLLSALAHQIDGDSQSRNLPERGAEFRVSFPVKGEMTFSAPVPVHGGSMSNATQTPLDVSRA